MEIYPEQLPAESQPDPRHRSEDRVFDAIQDRDGPGSSNRERQPDPEAPGVDFTRWLPGVGCFLLEIKGVRQSPERGKEHLEVLEGPGEKPSPLGLARDAAMAFRAGVVYIQRDFCCPVIAALLFRDTEQGPSIVAGARRSNVQVLWGQTS